MRQVKLLVFLEAYFAVLQALSSTNAVRYCPRTRASGSRRPFPKIPTLNDFPIPGGLAFTAVVRVICVPAEEASVGDPFLIRRGVLSRYL